ncbi:MAG: PAS-domain containing protein [Lentilitoribacter sp.]
MGKTNRLSEMVKSGLDLITQAITIYDENLNLVLANKRFQDMFQIPENLMKAGTTFEELLRFACLSGEYGAIEDTDQFVTEKVDLARKFEPHYFERTRANGTSISVEGCPLQDGGWISVFTDITPIKKQEELFRSRAENLSNELIQQSEDLAQANREMAATVRSLEVAKRQLTESRARLEFINRMTPAHIAHVNADGHYTHSNGNLARIYPTETSDIVGQDIEMVLGSEIWPHVQPVFIKALKGEAAVAEFKVHSNESYIRLAMSPDIKDDGTVNGAFILSTDVTQEAVARRALAHSRRKELANQLTSIMAHDFSNLLTIIMGQQNKLAKCATDDPTLENISETIKSAARRGSDLIESLNQFDTKRNPQPAATEVANFARNIEQLCRAALPESVEFEFSCDVPDSTIMLDKGFAKDAILNLVINGSEACCGAGTVSVTIDKDKNDRLRISVLDNGPGFSDVDLENALKPFYTTKSAKMGRGLGLTSAFDFAKSCNGDMKIKNRELQGAAITLRIPYQAVDPEKTGLVLLVDDDDIVRKTARDYLRETGHTIIEASDVQSAKQLTSVEGLSFIISDLDLGNGDTGLDLIHNSPDHIPKLIITGLPTTDELRKSANNACLVLDKPFNSEQLVSAMLRAKS